MKSLTRLLPGQCGFWNIVSVLEGFLGENALLLRNPPLIFQKHLHTIQNAKIAEAIPSLRLFPVLN
jgi:hypothetical protein